MKSKLPANFLISLKKGSVKISENKKPAIEFSTKNDDRVVKYHINTCKNFWQKKCNKETR